MSEIKRDKSYIQLLPDYLIENYIIPYLTVKDLFEKVRVISSEMYTSARNQYNINFPEEMMRRLKNICDLNPNEELIKQFTSKSDMLLHDKNTIFIYSVQINFCNIITNLLDESINDVNINSLLQLFYLVLHFTDQVRLLYNKKIQELKSYHQTEQSLNEIKSRIEEILELDQAEENSNLNLMVTYYRKLNNYNYYIRISEEAGLLFLMISKLLKFQIDKLHYIQIKQRLNIFFEKITVTSNLWPIQKQYFENTLCFIEESKVLTGKSKEIYYLFERFEIEHPLNDYIIGKIDIGIYEYDKQLCRNQIVNNRKLLNKAIIQIDKMAEFYYSCLRNSNIDPKTKIDDYIIICGDKKFLLVDFLFILSMIKPNMSINPLTFSLTNTLIEKYLKS